MTDTEIQHPQVILTRGENPEECVRELNFILRYSHAIVITNTEFTADEDSYILLTSILSPDEV